MINLGNFGRLIEMFPAELRLARRAKSGNVGAFVELCDQHIQQVYRYIHFLVPNNRVAEGLTVQVFFKAWEGFEHYPMFESSFLLWLYSVAHEQVIMHHRIHPHNKAPDNAVTMAVHGEEFRQEFQSIRDVLRSLPADQQQVLVLKFIAGLSEKDITHLMAKSHQQIRTLQADALCALTGQLGMRDAITLTPEVRRILDISLIEISNNASTLDASLLRHFKTSPQLEPILKTALLLQLGHDVKPTSAFETYTHYALVQYLRTRPRRAPIVSAVAIRRTAMAFSILIMALMLTGTAYAQTALPGDAFYSWKRASENILYALSPNPVATDIFLAERRLHEWIAVADTPELSLTAMQEYQEALSALKPVADEENLERIENSLQTQQEALLVSGMSNPYLNEYLAQVSTILISKNPSPVIPLVFPATATATANAPLSIPTDETSDTAKYKCPPICDEQIPGNGNANGIGNDKAGSNNAGGNENNNAGGNSNNNAGGNENNNAGGNSNNNAGGNENNNAGGNSNNNAGGNENNNAGGNDNNNAGGNEDPGGGKGNGGGNGNNGD